MFVLMGTIVPMSHTDHPTFEDPPETPIFDHEASGGFNDDPEADLPRAERLAGLALEAAEAAVALALEADSQLADELAHRALRAARELLGCWRQAVGGDGEDLDSGERALEASARVDALEGRLLGLREAA